MAEDLKNAELGLRCVDDEITGVKYVGINPSACFAPVGYCASECGNVLISWPGNEDVFVISPGLILWAADYIRDNYPDTEPHKHSLHFPIYIAKRTVELEEVRKQGEKNA